MIVRFGSIQTQLPFTSTFNGKSNISILFSFLISFFQDIKFLLVLWQPYFPVPKGEQQPTQYVMRKVAPRRVWPLIGFGASLACWYEHISRTICLVICKNHRFIEFVIKLVTRNR